MKIFSFFLFAVLMTTVVELKAQTTAESSKTVLQTALNQAGAQKKKVLLMFHASWCGWCHRMDSSLADKSCSKFFNDNFVITHITVMESKGKENLENPGGKEMMEKYNGMDMGLPYWIILDKDGKLLADSRIKQKQADGTAKMGNIGCPATQEEVNSFIEILKKTIPLNADQLAIIAKRFRQNEK